MNDLNIKMITKLIDDSNDSRFRKFNLEQKINFSYMYWKISPDKDILDVYKDILIEKKNNSDKLPRNLLLQKQKIRNFINVQGITRFSFNELFEEYDIETISKRIEDIKNYGNWLGKYDIEKSFDSNNKFGNPVYYSYLLPNGDTFKINKKTANEVIQILEENKVPTTNKIVKEGFRYYANDIIDEYIESLHKNDEKIKRLTK